MLQTYSLENFSNRAAKVTKVRRARPGHKNAPNFRSRLRTQSATTAICKPLPTKSAARSLRTGRVRERRD